MLNSPAGSAGDPLVAGVEAAGVAAHRDQPGLAAARHDRLGVGQRVASGISTCTCLPARGTAIALRGVHLRRRAEDHGVDVVAGERLGEVGRDVADAESAATFAVSASSRPIRETTSTPSMLCSPSRCLMPNAPAPARAMWYVSGIPANVQTFLLPAVYVCPGHQALLDMEAT